jgi:peptidyl-prolyl cis-trans isomerase C
MNALGQTPSDANPEFNYHMLRNALEGFSCNLADLSPEQYQQVQQKAERSYALESLVLGSREAQGVMVPMEQLDQAVKAVAGRYGDEQEFVSDLAANGLDRDGLRRALERELMFDAVMMRVSAGCEPVTEVDAKLFYEMHREKFEAPEQRLVRHILITINEEYPENQRDKARSRVESVREELGDRKNRFADIAKRHSECPTAMEGGKLGEVPKGTLYPELDAVLFTMNEGEISEVVESEIGFHILLCEKIKPGKRTPFNQAEAKIRELLEQRRRRSRQKEWLSQLPDA